MKGARVTVYSNTLLGKALIGQQSLLGWIWQLPASPRYNNIQFLLPTSSFRGHSDRAPRTVREHFIFIISQTVYRHRGAQHCVRITVSGDTFTNQLIWRGPNIELLTAISLPLATGRTSSLNFILTYSQLLYQHPISGLPILVLEKASDISISVYIAHKVVGLTVRITVPASYHIAARTANRFCPRT